MRAIWVLILCQACSTGQPLDDLSPSGGSGGRGDGQSGAGAGGTSGPAPDEASHSAGGAGGVQNSCGAPDPGTCASAASSCSLEDSCTELHCGELWSDFDEHLCRRVRCTESSECAESERCTPAPLLGYFGLTSSGFGCEYSETCDCFCGQTADALPVAHCLPVASLPESECSLGEMDCIEAAEALDTLEVMYLTGNFDADLTQRLQACKAKLAERADCDVGGAGAGGMGGAQ